MALRVPSEDGEMVEVLPSHDPEELDTMLGAELIESKAIGFLRDLVSIAPATPPTTEHIGMCHYCGEKVRNIHSLIIYHTEGCYWKRASDFLDSLPSEWDE